MSHTKTIGDLARLSGKKALDGAMLGDEGAIRHALRGLKVQELKEVAVDAVILHQYCMEEIRKRDLSGERPSVEELAAQHPLA